MKTCQQILQTKPQTTPFLNLCQQAFVTMEEKAKKETKATPPRKTKKTWNNDEVEKLLVGLEANKSYEELADELQVTQVQVCSKVSIATGLAILSRGGKSPRKKRRVADEAGEDEESEEKGTENEWEEPVCTGVPLHTIVEVDNGYIIFVRKVHWVTYERNCHPPFHATLHFKFEPEEVVAYMEEFGDDLPHNFPVRFYNQHLNTDISGDITLSFSKAIDPSLGASKREGEHNMKYFLPFATEKKDNKFIL
ncbi:hypothetical protein QOT17_016285 [Balamuthia mandrillaris]